jgi:hypothetical protein
MYPNASTAAGVAQLTKNAIQNSNRLTNTYQGENNTAINQNNANYAQKNQAYGNLLNYTQNLPSFRNMYSNYYKQGEAASGFNPSAYAQSVQNLTNAQNIQAGMGQAATSAGNYSGATAGQITQDYQNMANSINPYVTNATNAMHNWQAALSASQNYANQASTTAVNGETLKANNYNNLMTGANNAYGTGVSNLNNIGNLLQGQGTALSNQINNYNSAYSANQTAQQTAQKINMANQVNGLISTIMGGGGTPAQKARAQALMDEITKTNVNMNSIYGINNSPNKSKSTAKKSSKAPANTYSGPSPYSFSNTFATFRNPIGSLSNLGTDIGLVPVLGAEAISKL